MTAPLSTLRNGVGGRTKDAPVEIKDNDTTRPRIIHLADSSTGHAFALCGKLRDRPLDPTAEGQACVVCLDLYERKHGHPWRGC